MVAGTKRSRGVEQRRFARSPINLEALLTIEGGPLLPCTARNFCSGGMFLSADPAAYDKLSPPAPATLYFTLIVGGERQDFELHLTIVRAVSNGLGVAFKDPDPTALELLGKLAAPDSTRETASAPAGTRKFAPEYARIIAPLTELVKGDVADLCKRFLDHVDEALFVAARDARSNVDETRFLDGQREMRGHHKRVLEEAPQRIEDALSKLDNPLGNASQTSDTHERSELSLVDRGEFEEFLLLSEILSELELAPQLQEQLVALERRFSYLANRELDLGSMPIGPGVLCNAIAEPLKDLQSEGEVIARIYGALRGVMLGNLGRFYDKVNAFFLEHGVLAEIQPREPASYNAEAGSVQAVSPSIPPGFDQTEEPPPASPDHEQLSPLSGSPGFVRGAPPSLPRGFQRAVPPPTLWEQVRNAPPSVPRGFQQASPPTSGRQVRAAPPSLPTGVARTVPPPMSRGQVRATSPSVPLGFGPTASATPGAVSSGPHRLPAGWGVRTTRPSPTLQQVYAAAQAQMALGRRLTSDERVPAGGAPAGQGYSATQLLQGLNDLQLVFATAPQVDYLDVEDVKRHITESLVSDGAPAKGVEDEAARVIEVVANLFGALLEDALVANGAKLQLSRLQPMVHRAALSDSGFLTTNNHPLRELINRIARISDGRGPTQQRRAKRVGELVTEANLRYHDDPSVLGPIIRELDRILAEQELEYRQGVVKLRRGASAKAAQRPEDHQELPEKWHKWLERARKLRVGQRVLMNANAPNGNVMTLVWKQADDKLFVFSDTLGNLGGLLTLLQLGVALKRGLLKVINDDPDQPAFERAMFGAVDRFHQQVESQTARDPLTGFLDRRAFADHIDTALRDLDEDAADRTALSHIEIRNLKQINQEHGIATGDALIEAFAKALAKSIQGKDLAFGRLGGTEFGLFWPSGGTQGAYCDLQEALGTLGQVAVHGASRAHAETESDNDDIEQTKTLVQPAEAKIAIGLIGGDYSKQPHADTMLAGAKDACEAASSEGVGAIHVALAEQPAHPLEEMVTYASTALQRNVLLLLTQSVHSLTEPDLAPALHVTIGTHEPGGKQIPAALFMPALARCENADAADLWAFKRTLEWMLVHPAEADRYALVIVPLSEPSMRNEGLPTQIMTEFMQIPIAPGRICFEIPDRAVIDNLPEARELIKSLKTLGCRFVLDEFGSGRDNYDYLKELDVDYVTVRTDFVDEAPRSSKDLAMLKSINELVHFMGKKTVAKQKPDAALSETMHEIGIDFLYDLTERTLPGA